nr:uncharacterized protein LOC110791585 [Spinacia oleracea]
MVADLIDRDGNSWDVPKVEEVFNSRDSNLILAIPLRDRFPADSWAWAWSKHGAYEVRSAYHLGQSHYVGDVEQRWCDLWKADISPKVRHFLWRCCSNSLPTKALLRSRHIADEAVCALCGEEDETLGHALFSCSRVRPLWTACDCDQAVQAWDLHSFGETMASWMDNADPKLCQRVLFLIWSLWHRRNKWTFDRASEPDCVFVNRVGRLVEDFGTYTTKIYGKQLHGSGRSSGVRAPPSMEVIKSNVDASLCVDGWVGLGAVARNWKGEVLFAAVRRHQARWSPLVAESKAALFGLKKARQYGFQDVILESDSETVVSRMSKNSFGFSLVDNVLEDISSYSCNFNFVSWSHVRRDGNSVAHHLAKLVPFGFEQCCENHSPSEISPYVLMDSLLI